MFYNYLKTTYIQRQPVHMKCISSFRRALCIYIICTYIWFNVKNSLIMVKRKSKLGKDGIAERVKGLKERAWYVIGLVNMWLMTHNNNMLMKQMRFCSSVFLIMTPEGEDSYAIIKNNWMVIQIIWYRRGLHVRV